MDNNGPTNAERFKNVMGWAIRNCERAQESMDAGNWAEALELSVAVIKDVTIAVKLLTTMIAVRPSAD